MGETGVDGTDGMEGIDSNEVPMVILGKLKPESRARLRTISFKG